MGENKNTNPLDALLPAIAGAVHKWQLKNDPDVIAARVTELLDKNSELITMKLLGFDGRYDKWQLDYCNGRNGNSTAGDILRDAQGEAIKKWLSSVKLPELSKKQQDALTNQAMSDYLYALNRALRELVQEKAQEDAQKLIDSVTVSNNAESFIKLTELISSKPKTKEKS